MMERDWSDFKALYSLEGARSAFEKACESLLRIMFKQEHVQQMALSQGDGGIDIFIGDIGISPIGVYQCKFFLDKIGSSQKQQIKESFITAITNSNFKVKYWTLCVPRVFTNEEHTWWVNWKSAMETAYDLEHNVIRLFNGNHLIDEMKKAGIYNQIFKIEDSTRLLNIENIVRQLLNFQENLNNPSTSVSTRLKSLITNSTIYQNLQNSITEKRKQLDLTNPGDTFLITEISNQIKIIEEELNGFVKKMIALDHWFQSIEINSARLADAKRLFEIGEFEQAAASLSTDELDNEVAILRAQKDILEQEKTKIREKLNHLAEEYLLKASLASVNYSNKNYKIQTEQLIFKALSSNENFSLLHEAANIYDRIGEKLKGIECLEKAAGFIYENVPERILLHYNLGTLYSGIDNLKSEYHLEKTIALCQNGSVRDPLILTILANALHNSAILYESTDVDKHINLLKKAINIRIDAAKIDPLYYTNACYTLNRLSIAYYNLQDPEKLLGSFEKSLKCMELFIKYKPQSANLFFQEESLNTIVFTPNFLKFLGQDDCALSYKDRLLNLLKPFADYVILYHKEDLFSVARAYESFIRFYGFKGISEPDLYQLVAKMIYFYKESIQFKIPDDDLYKGLALGSSLLSRYLVRESDTKKVGYKMAIEARAYFDKIQDLGNQFQEWKENHLAFIEKMNECQCEDCIEMRN